MFSLSFLEFSNQTVKSNFGWELCPNLVCLLSTTFAANLPQKKCMVCDEIISHFFIQTLLKTNLRINMVNKLWQFILHGRFNLQIFLYGSQPLISCHKIGDFKIAIVYKKNRWFRHILRWLRRYQSLTTFVKCICVLKHYHIFTVCQGSWPL